MREPRRLREDDENGELADALREASTLPRGAHIDQEWQRLQTALTAVPADRIDSGKSSSAGLSAIGKSSARVAAVLIACGAAYWAMHAKQESPAERAQQPAIPSSILNPSPMPIVSPSPIPKLSSIPVPTPILNPQRDTSGERMVSATASKRPRTNQPSPARPAAPEPQAQLEAEIALLTRAEHALPGTPAAALELLAQHERLFAHGLLVEEREVLRIDAERALGRATSAAERARAFIARFPRSPQRPRFEAWLSTRSHDADSTTAPNNSQPELIPNE